MDKQEQNFNTSLEATTQEKPLTGRAETVSTQETEYQPALPLASGIGRRNTKTAEVIGKAGRWFGLTEERERLPDAPVDESDAVATQETTTPPEPAARPRNSKEIGRGGVSAIALLLVFVPLMVFLVYLLQDANNKVSGLERNLREFNLSANSNSEAQFVALLSETGMQPYPFKAEDGTNIGRVVLYNAGRLRWAFSYGKLEPLAPGQMYVMWLASKPLSNGSVVIKRLVAMPDVRTGGRAIVLRENDFPPSFNVSEYAELFVTIEPADKVIEQPTGPRRYALNLSQVRG